MENLIASDPGGRNVFGLVIGDQLRLAAQSLRLARRVGIVSGFFVPAAGAGETDGPPGAYAVGRALEKLGVIVDYLTDHWNAALLQAIGVKPLTNLERYLDSAEPTHLVSIERAGRGRDGRYRNMRGDDISATTAPLDELFMEATRRGFTTIGIGDGGNEIGMGKVFAETLAGVPHGKEIACIVPTDFCIAAGVSNWGAYGLAGALSVLAQRDLLPSPAECIETVERMVRDAGAVDGRTHRREPTVDGLPLTDTLRMIEDIRSLIKPSPLESGRRLRVGVLGYGETGRAAARLLSKHGHAVRISDDGEVTVDAKLQAEAVETGRHTPEFLQACDLVVASPGVRPDSAIRGELHARGIPVMSELELAYQLCDRPIIGVTGTIGKRTTVETIQRLFQAARRPIRIGGNKGAPLSAILAEADKSGGPSGRDVPIALAVSSFQLETIVHFRPHIAVVLNIDEAHLDRHRSIAEYIRIKSRIFMNHRPDDVLILPFDDERLRPLARKHHGRTLFISRRQEVDRGAWLAGDRVRVNLDGLLEECPVAIGPLAGAYFPEDLLSAALVARLHGIVGKRWAGP